jgi:pSer/pThr/pTyr-binding forkhead associated (FHA) protein
VFENRRLDASRSSGDNGCVSASQPLDANGISDSEALAEAERSGRPFLVFRDRDGRQQLFLFAPGSASASVGRRPSSDLVIDWDPQVSRLHARFERAGEDGWAIVDDGPSSNGTFVNEERVSGTRALRDGDIVRFGATRVLFRAREPAQRRRPADPAEMPAALQLSSTQRRVLTALCRPCKGGVPSAQPATDQQIAQELVLSVGEVRGHLKVLYARLGLEQTPHSEPRARLVERALSTGLIAERDL